LKAPPFEYYRPESLDEVLTLVGRFGDDAQILAGGQSLVPMINMRLASPGALIDINRVAELRGIEDRGDMVRIGAMTRYFEIAESDLLRKHVPLLPLAVPLVAHVAVRNRGTLGGSVCLSDPAGEMPACCIALGTTMVLASRDGRRNVAAEDFSTGLYATARKPDEVLVEILVPKAKPNDRQFIQEFSRRRGDFAIVGIAGKFELNDRVISAPRLVFFGCGTHSGLAKSTAKALDGGIWSSDLSAAAANALAEDLDPIDNVHASARYRDKTARVLLRRAVDRAVTEGAR
jgi:aerobic carbon-monoxide dehydrogenase medium subunit